MIEDLVWVRVNGQLIEGIEVGPNEVFIGSRVVKLRSLVPYKIDIDRNALFKAKHERLLKQYYHYGIDKLKSDEATDNFEEGDIGLIVRNLKNYYVLNLGKAKIKLKYNKEEKYNVYFAFRLINEYQALDPSFKKAIDRDNIYGLIATKLLSDLKSGIVSKLSMKTLQDNMFFTDTITDKGKSTFFGANEVYFGGLYASKTRARIQGIVRKSSFTLEDKEAYKEVHIFKSRRQGFSYLVSDVEFKFL